MGISNYIRSGKGYGLYLVGVATLVLSILYGAAVFFIGMKVTTSQPVEEFIQSVPSFTVQDGVIQDNNIRWHFSIPQTPIMVVIDTTQPELKLPVADGVYITSEYAYFVAQYGMAVEKKKLEGSFDVNPEYLKSQIKHYLFQFAKEVVLRSVVSALLGFLLIVALSAILGWICHATLRGGRVWRGSVVAWLASLLISLVVGVVGIVLSLMIKGFVISPMVSLVIIGCCIVLNVVWLKKVQD